MGTDQKETNRHRHQEFLRWRVLVSIVYLFPHSQVIVSSRVELKRSPFNLMKHNIRTDVVRQVGQSPSPVVVQYGDEVEEQLQKHNENDVDDPSTFLVHPVRIDIGIKCLVDFRVQSVWLQVLNDGGRPSGSGINGVLMMRPCRSKRNAVIYMTRAKGT